VGNPVALWVELIIYLTVKYISLEISFKTKENLLCWANTDMFSIFLPNWENSREIQQINSLEKYCKKV